jgi:hypothetical protein
MKGNYSAAWETNAEHDPPPPHHAMSFASFEKKVLPGRDRDFNAKPPIVRPASTNPRE